MARARNEAPKMEVPAGPPPTPAGAPKKRVMHMPAPVPEEALVKKAPKRTASKKHEAPIINRIKPFVPSEDVKEAAGLYHRRDKAAQAATAEDLTDETVLEDDGEAYAEYTLKEGLPSEEDVRAELKKRETPVSEDMADAYAAAVDAEEMSEDQRALAAYREAHPVKTDAEGYRRLGEKAQLDEAQSKAYEAKLKREAKEASAKETVGASGLTAKEDVWFKQGMEDEARQMAEVRATIERGGKGELMIEKPEDISADIAEAKAMLERGDLDPRDFSLNDYTYLLNERVRIDKEVVDAGYWQARKLRKNLKLIKEGGYGGASGSQGLDDYERQKTDVKSGDGAAKLAAKEKAEPKRKLSFWERLRMGKGR